jgi:hypothetical protein
MTPIRCSSHSCSCLMCSSCSVEATTRGTAGTGSRAARRRLAHRPFRPSDDQIAVDSPRSREPINQGPWAVVAGVGGARPGNPWRERREIHPRALIA